MQTEEISIVEDIIIPLPDSIFPLLAESDFSSFPFSIPNCSECPLQKETNKLRSEVGYWRSMHRKAKEREAVLRKENKDLKAKVRLRERQLFGDKSEQSKGENEHLPEENNEKKNRGQQKGAPGHGRKKHKNLSVVDEFYDLPEEEKVCECCGLPFEEFSTTEQSEVVEIDIRAHMRRIHRKRYKRSCTCANLPVFITAPGPEKLIPKGGYGDSVWIQVLLDKFLFYSPANRLLKSLNLLGLEISQGTVTGGLKRLAPLFDPVYEQIISRNQAEPHWHADETRWTVFVQAEGKSGYRWYLWVFKSADTVVYILDQSRSSRVPLAHLVDVDHESILSVDRYAAYKCLVKEKNGVIRLAWCWAHMRRDFLSLARDRPEHEEWAMVWVERIGNLYHLNNLRTENPDDPKKFQEPDKKLRKAVEDMAQDCAGQLTEKILPPDCRKVLNSLQTHWEGLTLFIDHPEIPMDNNAAERALRGPVVGRKNFYGSGSLWSGQLAAMLFSVFQTLLLWNINPRIWLERFFRACAENGGSPPEDVSVFLPWEMTEQEIGSYKGPPPTPAGDTSRNPACGGCVDDSRFSSPEFTK